MGPPLQGGAVSLSFSFACHHITQKGTQHSCLLLIINIKQTCYDHVLAHAEIWEERRLQKSQQCFQMSHLLGHLLD